jgi:hypothetical protein
MERPGLTSRNPPQALTVALKAVHARNRANRHIESHRIEQVEMPAHVLVATRAVPPRRPKPTLERPIFPYFNRKNAAPITIEHDHRYLFWAD